MLKAALFTPLFILMILVIVCLDIWTTHFRITSADEEGIWKSTSPDGQFEVVGYGKMSLRRFLPTMPGSGGDTDGIIVLRDKKNGDILQKQNVDLVNFIDEHSVSWAKRKREVVIVGVDIIWQLPPETR
jgi:hypothetical protein